MYCSISICSDSSNNSTSNRRIPLAIIKGASERGGARALRFLAVAVFAAILVLSSQILQAQKETVLYSFPSSTGAGSTASLTFHNGNWYGTCCGGQVPGFVFELSPDGHGGWNETTLYSFSGGVDGSDPDFSYVVFDGAGNMYGTTMFGGKYGRGVAFELSPSGGSWKETVLHSFSGRYSSYPVNGLVMDSAGNLYGVTNNCCSGDQKRGAGVFQFVALWWPLDDKNDLH